MKTTLTCLFTLLASILAVLFVVASVLILVATSLEHQLLDPATYKRALAEQNMYTRLPELIAGQLTYSMTYDYCAHRPAQCDVNPFVVGSPALQACLREAVGDSAFDAIGKGARLPTNDEAGQIASCLDQLPTSRQEETSAGGPEGIFKSLSLQDFQAILTELLTPEWLQAQTESVIDQAFAYLRSETDTLTAKVSLVEFKERLAGPEGYQLVLHLANDQQPCTAEQLAAFAAFDFETGKGDLPLCRPSDEQMAVYAPRIEQALAMAASKIPDQSDLTQSPLFGGGHDAAQPASSQASDSLLAVIRQGRQIIRLSWLLPPLSLLLIALFAVRSWQGWLLWWGAPMLAVGLIGVGLYLAGVPLMNWAFAEHLSADRISPGGIDPNLTQAGLDLVRSVAHRPLTMIGLLAGIVGGIGLVMVLMSWVTPRGRGSGG